MESEIVLQRAQAAEAALATAREALREAKDAVNMLLGAHKCANGFSNGVEHNGVQEAEYWAAEAEKAARETIATLDAALAALPAQETDNG